MCVFVVLGGLRATFLCNCADTVSLLISIMYFMFSVSASNPLIGSPAAIDRDQVTTLGLGAAGSHRQPVVLGIPEGMTSSQTSSGLSTQFAAIAILGNQDAIALLLTLVLAVNSSTSAGLIAVPSILSFDIYKTYIIPLANPKQLINVSHIMICVCGLVMAARIIEGLAAGLTAWLVTAKTDYGGLMVATTGSSYATLAGNLAAVLVGLTPTLIISFVKPDNLDWGITRSINVPAEEGERFAPKEILDGNSISESELSDSNNPTLIVKDKEREALGDEAIMEEATLLRGPFTVAVISAIMLTLLMDLIVPIPMFLSHYVFSKGFFLG
ncbi:hypothetical protein LZ554_006741 [Drepanopeziza brunnea f. sp. 'monogermtubi']|nr:hypothetical protein LZ554_006741 [Drepanopeziza brunnea f. sp. 'monogermtubi']